MTQIFYAALEKRAGNYYSRHLSEADRLAIFEDNKREMAKRERQSGGYIRGGLLGAGIGAGVGMLQRRAIPIPGAIAGGLIGAGIGAIGDVVANANTADAQALMRMTPEQRRRAYIARYAAMRDGVDDEDRMLRRLEVQAKLERARRGDRPIVIVNRGR